MLIVIGTKNCSRCEIVKNILNSKEIKYEYLELNDISESQKSEYLNLAEDAGQISLPIILRNNKIITIQEV